MPYRLETRDGQHCVIKISDGQNMGCHSSRPAALAQMRAILANESDNPEEILHLAIERGEHVLTADAARYLWKSLGRKLNSHE